MNFLPWYNKPLIQFLENFLNKEMDIFEYGAGYSTLYYSAKVRFVCASETKKEWFDFVNLNKRFNNIEIKLCTDLKNFYQSIENFKLNKFDIIIVDSRDRALCAKHSLNNLKENGILILDNSERENLKTIKMEMIQKGFQETIFYGEREDKTFSTSSVFKK